MRVCWWLKAKVCVIQEATVFPPALNTRSYHLALQSLPTGPALSLSLSLSLSRSLCRYRIGPELFFGPGRTWQDRPWPVLFMLAHGNAIWLVWMITTATAGWPAASRNQGHSTSALRTFPALFSSACRWIIHPVQPQRHESTAQTPPQKKTAHSVYWYNNL